MNHQQNITRIKAVSTLLGPLGKDVVFVGGAVLSFYSDLLTTDIRPTEDIDVVIEIWTYAEYTRLDEKLREMGFVNDRSSGIICRYTIQGIIVDVLPTEEKVLNFSNRWYPDGHKNATDYIIDSQNSIKIFPASYFLAAKLEAFRDRGENDGRMSSDFEDIVFLLQHRSAIWIEIQEAPNKVKEYIQNEFKKLLSNTFIDEWIELNIDFVSPSGTTQILEKMKKCISL